MNDFIFSSGEAGAPAPLPRALREETRTYIEGTLMVDSPAEVNQGHCRVVADRAARRAVPAEGEPITMQIGWQGTGGKHYYLVLRGRYHDAQRPDGVGDPGALPFFSGDGPYETEPARTYR
jgi:hypothetical protein